MYPSLPDKVLIFISILLCGLAVKLLDDYIDEESRDYVPYMMCSLAISISLWREGVSLFLSSYIVGMFHDRKIKLISGFKAYHEQVLVFILSWVLTGLKKTVSSLLIICAIQLIDDFMDEREDAYEGRKNWAVVFGRVEALLSGAVFLVLALCIDMFKTICSLGAALIISMTFNGIKEKK